MSYDFSLKKRKVGLVITVVITALLEKLKKCSIKKRVKNRNIIFTNILSSSKFLFNGIQKCKVSKSLIFMKI